MYVAGAVGFKAACNHTRGLAVEARLRSPKTLWRRGLADYLFKLRTRYPSLPPITENPLVAAEPRARSEPPPRTRQRAYRPAGRLQR